MTTGLSWLAVRLDERWLSDARLERAWPPSSRDAALLAFGPLALPFHFARTRGHARSVRGALGFALGLLLGLFVLGLVAVVSSALLDALAWTLGVTT